MVKATNNIPCPSPSTSPLYPHSPLPTHSSRDRFSPLSSIPYTLLYHNPVPRRSFPESTPPAPPPLLNGTTTCSYHSSSTAIRVRVFVRDVDRLRPSWPHRRVPSHRVQRPRTSERAGHNRSGYESAINVSNNVLDDNQGWFSASTKKNCQVFVWTWFRYHTVNVLVRNFWSLLSRRTGKRWHTIKIPRKLS